LLGGTEVKDEVEQVLEGILSSSKKIDKMVTKKEILTGSPPHFLYF
jgi:hypothetical protein